MLYALLRYHLFLFEEEEYEYEVKALELIDNNIYYDILMRLADNKNVYVRAVFKKFEYDDFSRFFKE